MTGTNRTTRTTRVQPTSTGSSELHTGDTAEQALPEIKMPRLGEGLPERGDVGESIVVASGRLDKDYAAELAFNEEPVTIRIEPGNDEKAPMTVDVFCNGKGAEVLMNGKWVELNILPVGLVVTTKRKYVEILARSKQMKCTTPDHADGKNIDNNNVARRHSRQHVFSVIKDSEKGVEWMTRLMNESF